MKLKTFVPALAAVLALPAFAAINPGAADSGELFFVVQDSATKVSFTKDLGLSLNDFLSNGQAEAGLSFTVDIANDSNWASFLTASSAPASRSWTVLAMSNTGLSSNRLLTTVRAGVTETLMRTSTNVGLHTGIGATTAGSFFASVNSSGTHRPATDYTVNGSSVNSAADASPRGYFGQPGNTSGTLNSNMRFSSLNAVGASSAFYEVFASSAAPGGFVLLDRFDNASSTASFSFDGSNLNYSLAAAVPEPETYALMLAGLGALGLLISRRRA